MKAAKKLTRDLAEAGEYYNDQLKAAYADFLREEEYVLHSGKNSEKVFRHIHDSHSKKLHAALRTEIHNVECAIKGTLNEVVIKTGSYMVNTVKSLAIKTPNHLEEYYTKSKDFATTHETEFLIQCEECDSDAQFTHIQSDTHEKICTCKLSFCLVHLTSFIWKKSSKMTKERMQCECRGLFTFDDFIPIVIISGPQNTPPPSKQSAEPPVLSKKRKMSTGGRRPEDNNKRLATPKRLIFGQLVDIPLPLSLPKPVIESLPFETRNMYDMPPLEHSPDSEHKTVKSEGSAKQSNWRSFNLDENEEETQGEDNLTMANEIVENSLKIIEKLNKMNE